jgi:hypothetical protein
MYKTLKLKEYKESKKSNLSFSKRLIRKAYYFLNKSKVGKIQRNFMKETKLTEGDGYIEIISKNNIIYSENKENDKILKNGPVIPKELMGYKMSCYPPIVTGKECIAEISDVLIMRDTPIIITKTGKLVRDAFGANLCPRRIEKILESFGIHDDIELFDQNKRKKILKKQKEINTACLLISGWDGYGHWLIEHALRLKKLEDYENLNSKKVRVIIEENAPKWKTQYLEKIGWKREDVIYWAGGVKKVKKLVLPLYSEPKYKDILWLKKKMLKGEKDFTKKNKRIYISRKKSLRRAVLNEEEILSLLKKYKFCVEYLEDLSAIEQALLFSQAEIVIGTHGAGLINILFSDKIKVMEIFGNIDGYIDGRLGFYQLSLVMNHLYKPYVCDQLETLEKNMDSNIILNPIKFQKSLKDFMSY